MSERAELRSLAGMLGRILFSVALMMAIIFGVREGFALLVPADWCAGTPVDGVVMAMSFVFMFLVATPKNKHGYAPMLRLGATMLASLILAVLATRLAVGCTPLAAWGDEARSVAEWLIMFGILIPLAYLHREVIEPRWSRAMGESGGRDEEGGPGA